MSGEPVFAINSFAHDAGVAAVCDGEVLFAIEEERLNREKKTARFPEMGLREMSRRLGLPFSKVPTLAFPWRPLKLLRSIAWEMAKGLPGALSLVRDEACPNLNMRSVGRFCLLGRTLKRRLSWQPRIVHVNHLLAHAANCFYRCPFDDAAILVMDGFGDDASVAVFHGRGKEIRPVWKNRFFDSLGMFYAAVTLHLGWRTLHDEGTVMALAAYGSERFVPRFRSAVRLLPDGDFRINRRLLSFDRYGEMQMVTSAFETAFGPARKSDDPIEDRHRDLARAVQTVTEEVILHIARAALRRTKSRNLCVSGGVAMNCQANARLAREAIFENVYVPSSPSDAGTPLGAALIVGGHRGGRRPGHPSPFTGSEYTRQDCVAALSVAGVEWQRVEDPAGLAARAIAEGAIIGWFQGRCEAGPRALGNRSILADPRRPDVPDRLNADIKHRPAFRPYAPAVLAPHVGQCFEEVADSPYMSFALSMRPAWRSRVPAVVHRDGSARVQTVHADLYPMFYSLIEAFRNLTGVPMLVNTSFNRQGEPIAHSPADAVRAFCQVGLDLLFISDLVAWKPKSRWAGFTH